MKNKKTILILIILLLIWFVSQRFMDNPVDQNQSTEEQTSEVVAGQESAETFDQEVQIITEEEASIESDIVELESLSF